MCMFDAWNKFQANLYPKWWCKMVILPYANHPTRTNPGISNDPILRIQVCPTKGIIYTDPFLFFSDGIGTPKILFDRERIGFLGHIPNTQCMGPYIQYIYSYVHLPWKLTKCRNMYIKSKVFCFRKKRLRTCSCCSFCTLRQTSAVRCSSTWQGPEGAPGSLTAGSLRIPHWKRKIVFKKKHPFSGSMLIFQGVCDLIYPRC